MKISQTRQWKDTLYEIIFEADTPGGKLFDVVLIASIIGSVLVVMLDSVESVSSRYRSILYTMEWVFTLLFSLEYGLRLVSVRHPLRYATSFLGIIDLLAILPTYISLFIPGSRYLIVIRVLRVLRVFRVFKLAYYLGEADNLIRALKDSRRKIIVFLVAVMALVIVLGSMIYMIEGAKNGFTSIPRSIYWTIVTLTTVGYGDISPKTNLGQTLASMIMILGYGIIAVPTGIVTAELSQRGRRPVTTQVCPVCLSEGHDPDAVFCKYCATQLNLSHPGNPDQRPDSNAVV